jgi:hypothetical protein
MTAFGLHGSLLATAVIMVILLLTLVDSSALGIEQKRTSGVQIRRRRRSVVDIQRELGGYAPRAYRMENETFWKLHSNIALHLIHNNRQHDIMYRDWAPNGRILASTRIRVRVTVSANQKAPAGKKSNFESLVRISVTDAAPSRPCIRDRDSN